MSFPLRLAVPVAPPVAAARRAALPSPLFFPLEWTVEAADRDRNIHRVSARGRVCRKRGSPPVRRRHNVRKAMSSFARPTTPHVLVLGAGAAGLAAGAALARRTVAVTVLEARQRIGGRVDTRLDPVLGIPVEHGAEFVHGRPARTLELARQAHARLRGVPDRHLRRSARRLSDAGRVFGEAEQLLARGTRDDEPFATVLRRSRARADVASMARAFVRGFYLGDPRGVSSLALARMTRALDDIGGDAMSRVVDGYGRVLEPLSRAIRGAGGEIRLGASVEEVRWSPAHVELRARGMAGGSLPPVRGDRLVVTLPVSLVRDGSVRFSPPLREKQRAAAALGMGALVKVVLRFRHPPWARSRSLRGMSFLHVEGAPFPVLWTLAPLEAPVLVGWSGGPDAAPLAGRRPNDIVRAALRSAAHGLRSTARALEDALDGAAVADWTRDPLARGGYAVFPTGSARAAEALARSVEHTLFFAGEATAGGHAGTVDGALGSGERAAREVLDSLR
jgi:monoamine oxidase